MADELRSQIARETGLGRPTPSGLQGEELFPPLRCQISCEEANADAETKDTDGDNGHDAVEEVEEEEEEIVGVEEEEYPDDIVFFPPADDDCSGEVSCLKFCFYL